MDREYQDAIRRRLASPLREVVDTPTVADDVALMKAIEQFRGGNIALAGYFLERAIPELRGIERVMEKAAEDRS